MTTINPISNVKSEQNLRTVINQVVRQVSDVSGNMTVPEDGLLVFSNGLPPWGDPGGMLVHAWPAGHRWR